jgi:DNA repair protein Rad10
MAVGEDEAKRRLGRTFEQMAAVIGNTILVSRRQEGNPVLRHVRNVRWQVLSVSCASMRTADSRALPQYADIVPDYILGNGTAALYISLRYHLLKPEYLFHRIRELRSRRASPPAVRPHLTLRQLSPAPRAVPRGRGGGDQAAG